MAFLNDTIHTPTAHRITAVIAALITDLNNVRSYRKTVAELQKLTYRELDDLGLNRSGIKASAREAVYGH